MQVTRREPPRTAGARVGRVLECSPLRLARARARARPQARRLRRGRYA